MSSSSWLSRLRSASNRNAKPARLGLALPCQSSTCTSSSFQPQALPSPIRSSHSVSDGQLLHTPSLSAPVDDPVVWIQDAVSVSNCLPRSLRPNVHSTVENQLLSHQRHHRPKPKFASDTAADIPTRLLVEYLTSSEPASYQQLKLQLAPLTKVDAYLLLRQQSPQSLEQLENQHILHLIRRTNTTGLGGALRLIVNDIVGDQSPGLFKVPPGSQRRIQLLKSIIVGSCQHELFHLGDEIIQLFQLLVSDLQRLQIAADSDPPAPSQQTQATQTDHTLSDFPINEARTLVTFIVRLSSPELAPTLAILQRYLESKSQDFPTAREGAKLIDYYLQPSLLNYQSALHVVSMLRDTNAISKATLLQAQDQGKAYLTYLREAHTDSQDPEHADSLRKKALEVTLRQIALKCMLTQRSKGRIQLRKTFEALMKSLAFDQENNRASPTYGSPINIGFINFRTVFVSLVGQGTPETTRNALAILQRCPKEVLPLMDDKDMQVFCQVAFDHHLGEVATRGFLLVIKSKCSSPVAHMNKRFKALGIYATMVVPQMFLRLLNQLNLVGQSTSIHGLLLGLRILPLSSSSTAQLDLHFKGPQRATFISILAAAGLKEAAFELYQRWGHCSYSGKDLLSYPPKPLYEMHKVKEGDDGVVGPTPPAAVGNRKYNRHALDEANPIVSSPSCVLSLVRCLTKNKQFKLASMVETLQDGSESVLTLGLEARENLNKARFVIETYKTSIPLASWTHQQLTSLAAAYFYLRDSIGAFDALRSILYLRKVPDAVDISVLLGGLMHFNPDRAVDLLLEHAEPGPRPAMSSVGQDHRQPSQDEGLSQKPERQQDKPHRPPYAAVSKFKLTHKILSTLISRSLMLGRLDLLQKLINMTESTGFSNKLQMRAFASLLTRKIMSPKQTVRLVGKLVKLGWRVDGGLLNSVVLQLLKSGRVSFKPKDESLSGGQDSEPSGRLLGIREATSTMQAATILMQMTLRELQLVNVHTITISLRYIMRHSRSLDKSDACQDITEPDKKQQYIESWIESLDRMVYVLRWARYFDTGFDLEQGVPLSRSSGMRDGSLTPIDLEEMLGSTLKTLYAGRSSRKTRSKPTEATGGNEPTPNALPPPLFQSLIETYLYLGDFQGAAEVAAWMRDEVGVDVGSNAEESKSFVDNVKGILQTQTQGKEPQTVLQLLEMLAGKKETERTKKWWIK